MTPSIDDTTRAYLPGAGFARVRLRSAGEADAERIGLLHADSWRRHYRGAYADSFLDGDIAADRRAVWSERLAAPGASRTILAELDGRLVGFVHVVFDKDPEWGSLVDNLHVVHDRRRTGLGTRLLSRAAHAAGQQASSAAIHLLVLRQNAAAQGFYLACGATCAETIATSAPGGDPTRLNGTPRSLRMVWPDAAELGRALDR
jgi:GNAT superfamily N-acetyltransferase